MAIPLLAAAGASAASGSTWDKVADCESGGSWSADEGNGFYGGLQLTLADWEAHGGLSYAPTPAEASRSQQIAVAETILTSGGAGTFSGCGTLAGLAEDKQAAGVDTGVAEDALVQGGATGSTGAGDAAKGTGSSGTAKDEETAKGKKSDNSDEKGKASEKDDADSESGSGRHRGESADESETDTSDAKSGGRHAARDDDAEASGEDAPATEKSDSLISIADSLALVSGWSGTTVANIGGADEDAGAVLPGQEADAATETGVK